MQAILISIKKKRCRTGLRRLIRTVDTLQSSEKEKETTLPHNVYTKNRMKLFVYILSCKHPHLFLIVLEKDIKLHKQLNITTRVVKRMPNRLLLRT